MKLAWWLSLAVATACLGCDTPRDDYPSDAEAISFDGVVLGRPASVGVWQTTQSWKVCTPEWGEFGPWIDCSTSRHRAGRITSVECHPAESCRDVRLEGGGASYFPLSRSFSVTAVADIEGKRVERTETIEAELPEIALEVTPSLLVEGGRGRVCRYERPATTVTVTLDGVPIPHSTAEDVARCEQFVASKVGVVRVDASLVTPPLTVASKLVRVRARDEVEDVEVADYGFCNGGHSEDDSSIGAYPVDGRTETGKHFVSVRVHGIIDGESVDVPAGTVTYRDRDRSLTTAAAPEEADAVFRLDGPPAPDARIEVALGSRTLTFPVVVKHCE